MEMDQDSPIILTKVSEHSRLNKKFKRKQKIIEFKIEHHFENIDTFFENSLSLENVINEAVLNVIDENVKSNDLISAEIFHEELHYPIFVPPQFKSEFKSKSILNSLEKVVQSNKKFLLDGSLKMEICITENISGKGINRKLRPPVSIATNSKMKRSVITIKNKDNSCGYRAIFVSKYYIDNMSVLNKKEWQNVRKDVRQTQVKGAINIACNSGLDLSTPIDMVNINNVQSYLNTYQIIIIDGSFHHKPIFKGPEMISKIYIEHFNNHYNAIINIKAYIGRDFYCETCNIGYKEKTKHRCKFECRKCLSKCNNLSNSSKIVCYMCKRSFFGNECYNNHLIGKICSKIKKCEICLVEYKGNHSCEKIICKWCNETISQPHLCYMKKTNKEELIKEDNKNKVVLCYDIESTQLDGFHKPMLLYSKAQCDSCLRNKSNNCSLCNERLFGIGYNCVKDFVNYLFFDLAKKALETETFVYAFAHNAKGYDAHFILKEIYSMALDRVNLIMNGRKILKLYCENVIMIDSLSFFLLPLSKLPKAFGLEVSVKKGYFPHYFNQIQNWNYSGYIPDKEFFKPDMMKKEESEKFNKWYSEQKNSKQIFNFKKEIIAYCKNDVEILHQSLNAFRFNFKNLTNLDPITRCFTLASIGLEVYRALYLKNQVLGITKVNGYTSLRKKSFSCSCWLDWLQKVNNIKILREYKIGKFYADGYNPQTKTVYEFFGCYWHGCAFCYEENRDKQTIKRNLRLITPEYAYRKTIKKLKVYFNLGYKVELIWEHTYNYLRCSNNVFDEYTSLRNSYYKSLEHHGCATINEAFFGGRTNNLKFYHECNNIEELMYVDFCSLYPFVLKTKRYPIKHPIVINEYFDYSLKSYFGFIKCKIIAPRGLYFPVLPMKINDKLIFPLCYKCAKLLSNYCDHNQEDRCLINTWTTIEVLKAIEKGYNLVEIYEVLHYSDVDDSLFVEYMDMWLKIKFEASGWPIDCVTEEQQESYINIIKSKNGIILEKEKIIFNPALRYISKIMLNSFWGKLAQKPNKKKTEIVSTYDEYWKLLLDPKKEISGITEVNEHQLALNWAFKDINDSNPGNYILSIAAYVTAYARLELYEKIDLLETSSPECVLYFDTDSIIYIRNNINYSTIKCGDFLGELKDEIKSNYGKDSKCIKFVSLGPKNYAYQVITKDNKIIEEFKIKGITFNEKTSNKLKFDKMIEMANAYIQTNNEIKMTLPQLQIRCNKNHDLVTKHIDKEYRSVSTKRYIYNGNQTLPYGY